MMLKPLMLPAVAATALLLAGCSDSDDANKLTDTLDQYQDNGTEEADLLSFVNDAFAVSDPLTAEPIAIDELTFTGTELETSQLQDLLNQ